MNWTHLENTEGNSFASIMLSANATGQPTETQEILFVANKTVVPSGFTGMSFNAVLFIEMKIFIKKNFFFLFRVR